MKSVKVLFLIGSLFLFIHSSGQEKFLFEYKYVKGKSYRYQEESKFESVFEMNGQETKTNGSTSSLVKMAVEDISENGDIIFVHSLEDYKIMTKIAMMDTAMVMKDLLNRDFQTVISKRGRLIGSKQLDTTHTGNDFTDKSINPSDISKEFIVFPDKEVKIGETWKNEKTDTTKGTQMVTRSDIVYTLLGIDEKNGHACFKAGFTGKTEIGGKMTQMGMEFFLEGSGEISGTIWFDKETCIIISKESTNDQEMTMAMTGQMQMTIPVTSTTNSTFTLLE